MKQTLTCMFWLCSSLALPATVGYADDEFDVDTFEDADVAQPPTKVDAGFIQLGIGYNSDDTGKVGEFSRDLRDQGALFLGEVDLSGNMADGSTLYLDGEKGLYGTVLDAGYRKAGEYSLKLFGDQSQKVEMANVLTLYPSGNDTVLDLPLGFTQASDISQYGRRDLVVERSTYGIAMSRFLGNGWQATMDFSRQDKDGERSATGSQGFGGTGIIVAPVDYQHDQLTLGLDYSKDKLALGANYYLSSFDNSKQTLTFPNPNNALIGDAQLALPPSNEFSRFDLDGSYQLTGHTALSWLLNWGRGEQSETFLPYALNTGFYGNNFTPFAAGNLDGEVSHVNGRITLTSRPTNHWNYKLEYALRNRESDHSPYVWDSLSYRGSVTPLAVVSHVYGKDVQSYKAEAGYRFANRSRLRFGWQGESIDRDTQGLDGNYHLVSSEDSTDEDKFWASYSFSPVNMWNLTLKAEHDDRDADVSAARLQHLHRIIVNDQGKLETVGENTLPYYLSELEVDRLSINSHWLVSNATAINAGFSLIEEDFNDSYDGLLGRKTSSLDMGLSNQLSKDIAIGLYATYQKFEYDQDGTTSGRTDHIVTNLWTSTGEDETSIFGVNLDWQAAPKILAISADLSLMNSDSALSSYDRLNGVASSLPGYGADVVRLDIKGNWQLNPGTVIQLQYLYEDWQSTDFAWDGDLVDNIAFGWAAPDENSHILLLNVRKQLFY